VAWDYGGSTERHLRRDPQLPGHRRQEPGGRLRARAASAPAPTRPGADQGLRDRLPAAKAALDEAGHGFEDLGAVTTRNPFAVNDLWPDPTEPAG